MLYYSGFYLETLGWGGGGGTGCTRPHIQTTLAFTKSMSSTISMMERTLLVCCIFKLKSVRVHFAYGRIALTLELLGRFGRFLDEDDRCNPPVLLIPFPRLLGL